MNIAVQFLVTGLILLVCVAWIIIKIRKKGKKNDAGCCGCALHGNCSKRQLKSGSKECSEVRNKDIL